MGGRSIRTTLAGVMAVTVLSVGCAKQSELERVDAATRAEESAKRAEDAARRAEAAAQRADAAAAKATGSLKRRVRK